MTSAAALPCLFAIALLAGCAAGGDAPRPAAVAEPAAAATAAAVRVVPLNAGEAVFEPFFDPLLSGFPHWRVVAGGAPLRQEWCWVAGAWPQAPTAGSPAVALERALDLDVARYTQVVVAAAAPVGSRLVVTLATELGARSRTITVADESTVEHLVPLDGARRLTGLAIALAAERPGSLRLLWLGLADPARAEAERERWRELARQPLDPFLVPPAQEPRFIPAHALLTDAAGLERMRAEVAAYRQRHGKDPFDPARFDGFDPAAYIGETVGNDTGLHGRFGRSAERARPPLRVADAAFAAALARDAGLMRQALAAAVCLAQVPWWDTTPITRLPGSSWEVRPFNQSGVLWDLAVAMDLGGDLLTAAGRDLILRRLAEDGMGTMNYTAWRWEYIYGCNQLLAFARGRIPAYLVLEAHWTRVAPYTDLAMAEVRQSFALNLLPDGGFVEGPGYFNYTLGQALPAVSAYARVRGGAVHRTVPPELAASVRYAEVLATSDRAGGLIPLCDINEGRSSHFPLWPEVLAQLATLFPESPWVPLWRARLAELDGKMPGSALAWLGPAGERIPPAAEPAALVALPDLGLVASHRRAGGQRVKLLVVGGGAGNGHNHEDKGSFVLEYAGDTFACEPGGWSYHENGSGLQSHAQRHNMLLPTGCAGRPAPRNPLPVAVKPTAAGDATSFSASIEAGLAWPDHYRRWTRSFASPAPDRLVISDSWALRQGDGVDFTWVSRLPIAITGPLTAELRGRAGLARITAPAGTTLALSEQPLQLGTLHTLRIHQAGQAGVMAVAVDLLPLP